MEKNITITLSEEELRDICACLSMWARTVPPPSIWFRREMMKLTDTLRTYLPDDVQQEEEGATMKEENPQAMKRKKSVKASFHLFDDVNNRMIHFDMSHYLLIHSGDFISYRGECFQVDHIIFQCDHDNNGGFAVQHIFANLHRNRKPRR